MRVVETEFGGERVDERELGARSHDWRFTTDRESEVATDRIRRIRVGKIIWRAIQQGRGNDGKKMEDLRSGEDGGNRF